MSNITLPDNAGKVDTFTRVDGADLVNMQAIVPVDSVSGSPLDLATEATLDALGAAVATLNVAAAAIKTAVESLNGKTSAVNTGAIAGTVALDAPTLATVAQDATTQAIRDMSDSMFYVLQAMLDKMPRLSKEDRLAVQIVDASANEINSPYYGVASNLVGDGNSGRIVSRMMEVNNFSDAGSARLYQQIQVS